MSVELRSLGLDTAQVERADNLAHDIKEVVGGDGSDAVNRLGGADSPLYDSLVWARKLKKALDNGLREKILHLNRLRLEIGDLPGSGIPAKLKASAAELLSSVADILGRDAFYDESASLGAASKELDKLVASTTDDLARHQAGVAAESLACWQEGNDWLELSDEDRKWFSDEIEKLKIESESTLGGLKNLLSHDFSLHLRLPELETILTKKASVIRASREQEANSGPDDSSTSKTAPEIVDAEVIVRKVFKSPKEIDLLVVELNKIRSRVSATKQVRITWKEIE